LTQHNYLVLPDPVELLDDEDINPVKRSGSAHPALVIIRMNRYQTKKKPQKKFSQKIIRICVILLDGIAELMYKER